MSGANIGVQQTANSTTSSYDGSGFRCAQSPFGSLSHQFMTPGTFYYTSGEVDPYGAIIMRGKIIVQGMQSKAGTVLVKVNDVEAMYQKTKNSGSSQVTCQSGVTSPIPSCQAEGVPGGDLDKFVFSHWECSTPVVTSISPNSGTESDILVISGSGFSSTMCHNDVLIGGQVCDVISSSIDSIQCKVNAGGSMPAG